MVTMVQMLRRMIKTDKYEYKDNEWHRKNENKDGDDEAT